MFQIQIQFKNICSLLHKDNHGRVIFSIRVSFINKMLFNRLYKNKVREATEWDDEVIKWCLKEATDKGLRECDFWGGFALDEMKIQVYVYIRSYTVMLHCGREFVHTIRKLYMRTFTPEYLCAMTGKSGNVC